MSRRCTGFPRRILAPGLRERTLAVPRPLGTRRRIPWLRRAGPRHCRVDCQGHRGCRRKDVLFGGLPAGALTYIRARAVPALPARPGVGANFAGFPEGLNRGRPQRHEEGPSAVGHADGFLREEFFGGFDVFISGAGGLVSLRFVMADEVLPFPEFRGWLNCFSSAVFATSRGHERGVSQHFHEEFCRRV